MWSSRVSRPRRVLRAGASSSSESASPEGSSTNLKVPLVFLSLALVFSPLHLDFAWDSSAPWKRQLAAHSAPEAGACHATGRHSRSTGVGQEAERGGKYRQGGISMLRIVSFG